MKKIDLERELLQIETVKKEFLEVKKERIAKDRRLENWLSGKDIKRWVANSL